MSETETKNGEDQMEAYSEAVGSGRYVRQSGIHGKYDNVRIYWEDEGTRIFLCPYIEDLVKRRVEELKRVRILDIGCGSGDGFEMLMRISRENPSIIEDRVRAIQPDYLGHYVGVDLNEDLLVQARERWGFEPKAEFRQCDLTQSFPADDGEPAFDIYFTSFGTLSHFDEDTTVQVLSEAVKHADDGSLLIGDWLGRYAYEWQDLWDDDTSKEQWMEYVISYVYPEGERPPREDLAMINLRLMTPGEVGRIMERVESETGARLKKKEIFDRSVFVGRHIDTGDYNRFARPIRRAVNSLHEDNRRTRLDDLLFDYEPKPGFDEVNHYFETLQTSWNTLVRYAMDLCNRFDHEKGTVDNPPEINTAYPEPLKRAMRDMKRVVEGAGWFRMGDPRANVIEPQLGYALRGIEFLMQKGLGGAHGLVGIFEVNK